MVAYTASPKSPTPPKTNFGRTKQDCQEHLLSQKHNSIHKVCTFIANLVWREMSSDPPLKYEPLELSFQADQSKQLTSSVRLLNETDNCVAFKLKSTNPRNYVVKPRVGILLPRSICEIKVTTIMRAPREAHRNMRCKDKFMIQSAIAASDTTLQDARKLFDKEAGHPFQESILRVVYSRPTESSIGTSVIENTDPPALEANNPVAEHLDGVVQVTNYVTEPPGDDPQEGNINTSGEANLRSVISNWSGESILKEVIGSLLVLVSLYLMKQTISWIWSLVMFMIMLMMKMVKKLVSDSVEDWIVKTLLHIAMYILFGRKDNTGLT